MVKTARIPGLTYDGSGETRNMMNELSLTYSAPIDICFVASVLCPEKYSSKVPSSIWVPTNQIQASTEFELITNSAGNSFLLINPRRAGAASNTEMV